MKSWSTVCVLPWTLSSKYMGAQRRTSQRVWTEVKCGTCILERERSYIGSFFSYCRSKLDCPVLVENGLPKFPLLRLSFESQNFCWLFNARNNILKLLPYFSVFLRLQVKQTIVYTMCPWNEAMMSSANGPCFWHVLYDLPQQTLSSHQHKESIILCSQTLLSNSLLNVYTLSTMSLSVVFIYSQGTITDMLEENVVQPLLVSTSAIKLAAETVRSIMKVDDIVSWINTHSQCVYSPYVSFAADQCSVK